MDELTLLRKVRDDVAEPTTEALTAGRAALFERIGAGTPAPTRRLRPRRVVGLSALGVGALTVALVATNVIGLAGWRGGAERAAAEVLHSAALAAIQVSDPIVGPDQYLLVATTAVFTSNGSTAEGLSAFYQLRSTDELYLPANRADDWIWSRHPLETYRTFGPESAAVAEEVGDPRLPQDELLQAPAGAFYGGESGWSYGDLGSLPRDPSRLLNHIYLVTMGQGPSADGEALVFIADRLRLGAVPADLRAAFYEAAALIPGVTITEQRATLDGRIGVAIGRDEGSIDRQEIIIDPATGLFIGERRVNLSGYDGLPSGTVVGWSSVTTSVVNSAPQGGTVNGIFDVLGCISDGKGGSQCPPGN